MGEESVGKLNRLQRDLPEGLVTTAAWLSQQGYSPQLCNKYVAGGWLERLTHGVYRRSGRPGERLAWEQVVLSLQTHLAFPVVVGGRSALELQGHGHYVSFETRTVQLYGPRPLPGWLNRLPMTVHFRFHNSTKLFRDDPITHGRTGLSLKAHDGVSGPRHGGDFSTLAWGQWDWHLTLSGRERAVLEMLDGVPQDESFDLADKMMEGLNTLRPRRVQKLLADCKSVKVKRLFLFFATRHNHPWLKHIDQEAIDLGTGKRMVERGGRLDTRYQITVPAGLHADQ